MGQVFKMPPPKKDRRYAIFFISDLHSEHLHKPTYDMYLQHAQYVRQSNIDVITVIGGDYLDAAFLMKKKNPLYKQHLKNMSGIDEYFVANAEKEICWGNKRLDEIQIVSDITIFMEGNHDWRYREFMNTDCPHNYRHNFDLDKQLRLEERNISFIWYNDWLDIGEHLSFTHGMYHGNTALQKHHQNCGYRNVVFGHIHQASSKSFHSRGRLSMAWSNPCMSTLNPEYIKTFQILY